VTSDPPPHEATAGRRDHRRPARSTPLRANWRRVQSAL